MPAVIVVSASASNVKTPPFKSKAPVNVPAIAPEPVIVGLVNKFAIVTSFNAEALVSCSNKLSPVAGAAPKSV